MYATILTVLTFVPAADYQTPWERAYEGSEASGPHVLGLWKFDSDDGKDATGKQPPGKLRGGRRVADGRFGGALESFPGFPVVDRAHGFSVPNNQRLSPKGAFTVEFWLKPKKEFADARAPIALDKKYAGHTDYQLSFGPADKALQRRLRLSLGFGNDSHDLVSEPVPFPAGEWVHLAVSYDGQGQAQFFRNGEPIGQVEAPGRRGITAGSLPLTIGDRHGSNYAGCPAFLDEVRLTEGVRAFTALRLTTQWPRQTFVRHEPAPTWSVTVTSLSKQTLDGVRLAVAIPGCKPVTLDAGRLAAGAQKTVEQRFDTTLRPDSYPVTVSATWTDTRPRRASTTATVVLVPRSLPQMPVVMWGIGGVKGVLEELPRLRRIGFTHCFGGEIDAGRLVRAGEPVLTVDPARLPEARKMLDTALANDLRILATVGPSAFEASFEKYLQRGRDGKPYARRSLTPNAPELLALFERVGASVAKTYADHPAFSGMCVNSEVRDDSQVSFTEWDRAAYRRAFGQEMPDWVQSKYGPNHATLPNFPKDRVVADDDPRLAFYRWWWAEGDGWNAAHSAVHRGLHRSPRRDLWTFYDPSVRVPPLWGSGGAVDVLSQWTYTDPDPLRMAISCDEVLAMAAGRQPSARVMKMTQLFWYRSTAAPAGASPRDGDTPAAWLDREPGATFLSIHPLHLREAFWVKIARPFEGIMYHGWGSLVPTDGTHAYKHTHPQLQHELTRLVREVVQPLGPTLRQVPAARSDIAFLESFTSSVFARRGTWGWGGGWQADLYLALQYAHLQPQVLYEQTLLRDGLKGYKVLVLADCDVLPKSVVERIVAFQKAGGLVIGDDRLCPAIRAEFVLTPHVRTRQAAADKAALLERAAQLGQWLNGRYRRVLDVSNPEVVSYRRRAGSADYLFLVNDAREAGDYVGQYGRVEEFGRPSKAEVRLHSPATVVYDLVRQRAIPARRDQDSLVFPVELGPCDGRLLMALPARIARVAVRGPESVARGGRWVGRIEVQHDAGKPVEAVVPLEVAILDPDGRPAEFSGFHAAADGRLELTLDLAANDQPGVWEVRVRERASGCEQSAFFRLMR